MDEDEGGATAAASIGTTHDDDPDTRSMVPSPCGPRSSEGWSAAQLAAGDDSLR